MFGKKRKCAEQSQKNASKNEAPKMTPKRVPGDLENQLFQARGDFFITKRTHQVPPRGTKIAKSEKIRRFRK